VNTLDLICKHNLYHKENNMQKELLSDEHIAGNLLLFYLGGVGTTSGAARNSIAILLQRPEIKAQLVKEIS
jgi:cytochrome P450